MEAGFFAEHQLAFWRPHAFSDFLLMLKATKVDVNTWGQTNQIITIICQPEFGHISGKKPTLIHHVLTRTYFHMEQHEQKHILLIPCRK